MRSVQERMNMVSKNFVHATTRTAVEPERWPGMSAREEYTPDDEDVEDYFSLGATEYKLGISAISEDEARAAYRRWLAAHDRALRERIAREIEVMRIGSDAGRGSEVIAAHDSALSRAARITRGGGQ